MSYLDFPSEKDWEQIHQQSLCKNFYAQLNPLIESFDVGGGIGGLSKSIEMKELVWQLHYREVDVTKSFILLRYYFEKGIPDDEWRKSPGENGSSIQYFPHFEKEHFIIKDWFDYYSDTFYYKLFSAWDTIGHMLNIYFNLNIGRVDFSIAVGKIKQINFELWKKLDNIQNSPAYQKAKDLRNDVTHNYLPSSAGLAVTTVRSGNTITTSLGVRGYVTSKEIMNNVLEVLSLFQETIKIIAEK